MWLFVNLSLTHILFVIYISVSVIHYYLGICVIIYLFIYDSYDLIVTIVNYNYYNNDIGIDYNNTK